MAIADTSCLVGVAAVPADVISAGFSATVTAAVSEGKEEKELEPPRLYQHILGCEDLAAVFSSVASAESCY